MKHRGNATLAATRDDAPVDELTFRDLGLTNETEVFWGDFAWQFAERWKFRLSYSSFDATGEKVQTTGGNWDELEWQVGARLSTDFEMALYIADLTWDFLKTENGHLGVGLGLHAVDLGLGVLLEVGAGIGGEGGFVPVDADATSVLAPLPNVSLSAGYLIADKVYLSGSLGFFSLEVDKYDGFSRPEQRWSGGPRSTSVSVPPTGSSNWNWMWIGTLNRNTTISSSTARSCSCRWVSEAQKPEPCWPAHEKQLGRQRRVAPRRRTTDRRPRLGH